MAKMKNMTTGNPAKLIFFFTVPLLIGNLFQQFYNMADTFIVGRTIGIHALAALGSTASLVQLAIGFIIGLTSGNAIVTAQRFGAGKAEAVRKSFATSIILSIAFALLLMLLTIAAARPALIKLRTPPEIMNDAYIYLQIFNCGLGATMLFNVLAGVLRAVGDSRTPLIYLVVACVMNIALDLLFILQFGMGVAGAGLATVLSQLAAGALCAYHIARRFPLLRLKRKDWRVTPRAVWDHLRISLPMGFQHSLIGIGVLILQYALNGLGTQAVAAFTAAQKIDGLVGMPLMSFGVTMATYVAQNYGARKFLRIRKGIIQCAMMSVSFSIVMGAINIFAGQRMAAFFIGPNPEVVALAHTYLAINGFAYFVLALLFIFRYTLQGLGHSVVPTIAGTMELLMRAFAALILADLIGFAGISLAGPLAWVGSCIPLSIALYRTMDKLMHRRRRPKIVTSIPVPSAPAADQQ